MEKTNFSWTGWSIDYVKDECLILSVKYLNKGRKKIPTTIFKLLGPCESISYGQKFWVLSRRPHNFQTFRTVREYLLRAKILSFEPEASHISQFVTVVTVIDMHVSIGKAAAAQETTSRNGIVLPFNLSTSSRRTAYCPKKAKKATRWVNWYDAKEALKRLYFSDKFMSRQSCPRNQITQRCAHKWGASIIEHSQFSD